MQFVKSFIISALSTIVLSLVIFIGTISAMTGKFPPDLQKLKATFENTQKALKSSQKIMANTNWDELEKQLEGKLPSTRLTSANMAGGPTLVAPSEKRMAEIEFQNARLTTRVEQLELQVQNLRTYFDKTPKK